MTRNAAVAKVGPTVLVVSDLEDHTRSMIFMSSAINDYKCIYKTSVYTLVNGDMQ